MIQGNIHQRAAHSNIRRTYGGSRQAGTCRHGDDTVLSVHPSILLYVN